MLNRRLIIFLIILSAIAGLILPKVLPTIPVISDFADYDNVALGLLETGVYPTISAQEVIYPPLYPLFLALIYFLVGHSYLAAYYFQFLLLGGVAIGIFQLTQKYFGLNRWLSLLAALTIFIWPYFLLYSISISSEILFTFFLIWSVIAFFSWRENPSLKMSAVVGILLGLATLTRPVSLLLPLWLLIGLAIISWKIDLGFRSRHFRRGILIILVYLVTLAPWIAYVSITYNRLIPVSSNLSYVLDKANKDLGYLGEKKASVSLWQAKLTNIYLFWDPGASGYHMEAVTKRFPLAHSGIFLYKLFFVIMLLLAAWSLGDRRERAKLLIIAATILYFWALHTVLFPFPRYTLPVIPLVLILAFYQAQNLLNKYA